MRPDTILPGASVLITGGTGAFGRAFTRYSLASGARRVIILSRGEAAQAMMEAEVADPRMRFFIGDVRDTDRMRDACKNVDVVIHAAALKRVEICERDPREAQATNVEGTQAVARACIANGIQRAVLLSTDKAAAPHTLYGVTKLAAERLWLQSNVYAAGTATRFTATRYGNVLGSTGSIIPIWQRQAAAGQLLTITDPHATRFWMRMSHAVALVADALHDMRGGEIFIPKLGASTLMALLAAAIPDFDANEHTTLVTGLRTGEKRHETLITDHEAATTHDAGKHYIIEPPGPRSWTDLAPLDAPRVPTGFTYTSQNALHYSYSELRALLHDD